MIALDVKEADKELILLITLPLRSVCDQRSVRRRYSIR